MRIRPASSGDEIVGAFGGGSGKVGDRQATVASAAPSSETMSQPRRANLPFEERLTSGHASSRTFTTRKPTTGNEIALGVSAPREPNELKTEGSCPAIKFKHTLNNRHKLAEIVPQRGRFCSMQNVKLSRQCAPSRVLLRRRNFGVTRTWRDSSARRHREHAHVVGHRFDTLDPFLSLFDPPPYAHRSPPADCRRIPVK